MNATIPNKNKRHAILPEEIRARKLGAKKSKVAFPRGSLIKYLTPARNKEQLAILADCV